MDASLAILVLLGMVVFESWWQQAPTLEGVLERIRGYYRVSVFWLFLMHPSFWFVLFLYVAKGFHGALLGMILVMKASDIAFKLWLVTKIERDELSPDFRAMLRMPLSPWMPWVNVLIYPRLLAMALHG